MFPGIPLAATVRPPPDAPKKEERTDRHLSLVVPERPKPALAATQPEVPAVPAMVVTTPAEVIFRIV